MLVIPLKSKGAMGFEVVVGWVSTLVMLLKPRGVVGLVAARTGTVSATVMSLKVRYMRCCLICQPKEEIYSPLRVTRILSSMYGAALDTPR